MSPSPNRTFEERPAANGETRAIPWASALMVAALLVAFYLWVWLLPRAVRLVAGRSIHNYRQMAEEALARKDGEGAIAIIQEARGRIPRGIYFERPEFMDDWIGRIRLEQGQVAESLEAFLRAQKGFFQNIELRGYLPPPRLVGDIIKGYFATGNLAGAYNEACVGLEFYPMMQTRFLQPYHDRADKDGRVMRDLGLLALATDRLSLARDRLQRALRRDSAIPEAHYWLGRLREAEGDSRSGTTEYQAELSAFPYAANALARLIAITRGAGGDVRSFLETRQRMHEKAVAEFLPADRSQPLAGLLTIRAACEQAFELDAPGRLLVNILADSRPCHGLFGWVEVTLDGRHIQTLYIRDPLSKSKRAPLTYHVWLDRVTAGRHVLRIENLTDAADGSADRNVFIHTIRIYRLDD